MSRSEPDPAAGWNSDTRLSPFESLMWRSEVNPMLRSTGVLMEVLDHAPERERVVAAHEWGSRLLTPLRHRVVEDPLGISAPRWVVDREFDLNYHLRFVSLPLPGTIEQVLELAQALAMSPFDRARPLWEAMLIDGLDGGRAVYLLKLHHSITDGQGTVQMLDILHGEGPESGRARSLPVPAPENISGLSLAISGLRGAPRQIMRDSLKTAGRVVGAAESVLARPSRLRDAARYAQSLGRMLGPPPAPGSILLEQRSLGRRYALLEVPLDRLRAAGKLAGGTLNDAFLAGITGGMRRYHDLHGVELQALTVAFPISIRRSDDPLGSNRFAGARILAPITEPDPVKRIRLIGARTRAAREEPALGFMDTLSPALSRLPAAVAATLTERVTRSIDVQASNIKGVGRTAYLAGARVERTFAFGAAPGPAVMVTLMSYEGVCCIALTINAAAIPDREAFRACLEQGFDEVLALAEPEAAPSVEPALGATGAP
jgi:diacylglycerol O-acyltransferase